MLVISILLHQNLCLNTLSHIRKEKIGKYLLIFDEEFSKKPKIQSVNEDFLKFFEEMWDFYCKSSTTNCATESNFDTIYNQTHDIINEIWVKMYPIHSTHSKNNCKCDLQNFWIFKTIIFLISYIQSTRSFIYDKKQQYIINETSSYQIFVAVEFDLILNFFEKNEESLSCDTYFCFGNSEHLSINKLEIYYLKMLAFSVYNVNLDPWCNADTLSITSEDLK